MRKKLAIISTHPIQYQAPLWRALAQTGDLDVQVFFGSDFSIRGYRDAGFGVNFSWDVPLTEGYPYTFLYTDPQIKGYANLKLRVADLKKRLEAFQPDYALLTAYSPLDFYLKAILALRWLGIPILLRADATDAAVARSALKSFSRNVSLKILYRQIAGFLAVGYNSRHHYRSRGVPPERIYYSPFNIDSLLMEKQIKAYDGRRADLRRELGFTEDQFVFIFSGKLIPNKNPLIISEALSLLAGGGASLGLLVMGEGLLRRQFEAALEAIPQIKSHFAGFQNQSQLGRFYSAADCLILPSWSETWGLVVNEALQFGLPVLVSDRVGCWRDLVVPGETGYVFPAGDAAALAESMSRVMNLLALRGGAVREACRQKAGEYSVERAVAGIRKCLAEMG